MARTDRQYSLSLVPDMSRPRSTFDRTHRHITTIDAGVIYPIRMAECYPGDTIMCKPTLFGRILTLLDPIFDDVVMEAHGWLVPYRTLWDNFEAFMGEKDPDDTTEYLLPKITQPSAGWAEGSVADYFRLPIKVAPRDANDVLQAMPFRAYRKVYNDWYRDPNLITRVALSRGDGPDPETYGTELFRRGKRHDRFTAALPFRQRGPAVPIAIAGTAPLVGGAVAGPAAGPKFNIERTNAPGTFDQYWLSANGVVGGASGWYATMLPDSHSNTVQQDRVANWNDPNLALSGYADLSQATGNDVNALRESVALQHLLEADARGGARYVEHLRAVWGVTSPDFRLQRAEYLGSTRTRLNVSTIAQTSESGQNSALGDLGAMGTFGGQGRGFVKSVTEHSIFLVTVSVRAGLMYSQGIDPFWRRSSRWDLYFPQLAHIGEQPILNEELVYGGKPEDLNTWGYQEAWSELRHERSGISGKFRSNATQPLHSWHLSQWFDNLPVLGKTFIEENPPMDRVVAVANQPIFKIDALFQERWARQMPIFSVPGLRRL